MRGTARALLAALAAVALVLVPASGSAPRQALASAEVATVALMPADATVAAEGSTGGYDSWRSAVRGPRAPQSLGTAIPAVPPTLAVTALLLLLLARRRAGVQPVTVGSRRLNAVRGPPAPMDR